MSLLTLGLGSLFVFLAAIVRGYSGFGFSLLVITSLSLLMPPATFIPAVFMLEIAASLHIKIFTILVGKGGMVPFPNGTDIFGNPAYAEVEVDVNPQLLQQIADSTGGTYYRATDKETLSKGLNNILDKLDKSKIEEGGGYTKVDEVFGYFLLPGLALLTLELLLGLTRLRGVP